MNSRILILAGAVLGIAVVAWAWPERTEESKKYASPIELSAAPEAVQAVVGKRLPGARITKIEKILRDGKAIYEIEYQTDLGGNSLTLAATGDVIETAQSMKPDLLPAAVRDAVQKRYPNAKIVGTKSVVLHSYEVVVMVDGKQRDLDLVASGHLDEDDDDADEDEDEDEDEDD